MRLWDSLTTCLVLLSAVRVSSLLRSQKRGAPAAESPLEVPPVQTRLAAVSLRTNHQDSADRGDRLERGDKYSIKELLPDDEDIVEFIKATVSRVRRFSSSAEISSTSSSSSSLREDLNIRTRHRKKKKKKKKRGKGKRGDLRGEEMSRKMRRGGGGGRGQGCALKQIHLNVSDLGLGYRSSEEMIFRYCAGPCRKSETNYDKILFNLVQRRKLPHKDTPLQACCRPIAFDDDLSFLDDSLIYHTVRKHSARKCGCV
ncbi:glial cell line-derived neurotrophic factor [Kryptolebias marmoratus]|uniref:Glial cell line-derived neurotrophic factor n=1 Tax=Kryptolebias marmoratus TaxID=37003 RepID=A0A3Q3BNW7_KRYMA|nr:glial cell line-derived neurotrophic factor [Kryptolebias marmoratus]